MKRFTSFSLRSITVIIFCIITSSSYCQSCSTFDTISVSECNSYNSPSGIQYNMSGTYNDTIQNIAGCDSNITIMLQIFQEYTNTIFIFSCGDPYLSNMGNYYDTTGLYVEYYTSVNGCDSTIYVDVQYNSPVETSVTVSACDEYISDGGIVYTNSGTYEEFYPGSNGCDSAITYTITIIDANKTVVWSSPTEIKAVETGGTYQWIDCNNSNALIPGATSQTYELLANGSYACIVEKNGCIDTTNCLAVSALGFAKVDNTFSIYPNPSKGQFLIELNGFQTNSKLDILNTAGQIVYQANLIQPTTNINLTKIESGVYFVVLENERGKVVDKLIVN